MATIEEQRQAIRDYFAGRHIPSGLGTEEEACSIGGANYARGYGLTTTIAPEDSKVIGRWIIGAQDSIPDAMRNSDEWKELIANFAGTGRALEAERLAIIMDWMWGTVLPQLQPLADERGFGEAWRTMLGQRTVDAAGGAANAARADAAAYAADAASRAAAYAANAAAADAASRAAAYAANAADAAAYADAARATYGANAADYDASAAFAAARVARAAYGAAAYAAYADAARATYGARSNFWQAVDPCGLLKRLIELKG